MSFTVRTAEGQLRYASFVDLARAYQCGLVEASDEVRENDAGPWVRVGSHPKFIQFRPEKSRPRINPITVGLAMAMALFSFILFLKGAFLGALILGIAVCLLCTRLTLQAFRSSSPG